MTTLDVNQQAAVEQPTVYVAYFVELQFSGGTVRVCSYSQPYTWGGFTWAGLGSVGSISQIQEDTEFGSNNIMLTLNISDPSVLALAVASPDTYRGKIAKIYFAPLNSDGTLIGTPVVHWRGTMDKMQSSISGNGEGRITIVCETSSFPLKRRIPLRLNAEQQKQRMVHLGMTTDTGFDYLIDLLARPIPWLSKTFQKI
jgi:hypothetical protein